MNNSTSTGPELPVQMKWPFLGFFTFVFIGGAVGNALILFIYQFRIKKTVVGLLIQMLAVVDLGTVLVVVPASVANIFIPSNEVCKCLVYMSMIIALYSGLLLSVIAYQRYRMICHPHQRQRITRSVAKLAFIICGGASVCVNIPILITVSSKREFLTSNETFDYPTCHFTETTIVSSISRFITSMLFGFFTIFVFAMYVRIGRALSRHKMNMNEHARLRVDSTVTAMLFTVTIIYFLVMLLFGSSIRLVPESVPGYLFLVSALYLPSINCIVNPVSYFVISREFRSCCTKLCCNPTGQQIPSTERAETHPDEIKESGNL